MNSLRPQRAEFTGRKFGSTGDDLRPTLLTAGNAWRICRRRTGMPVGRGTWYRWLASGAIPSIRIQREYRIDFRDLEEFMHRSDTRHRRQP